MKAYIVEIQTPSGRIIKKGILAPSKDHAEDGIRHMQMSFSGNGVRKCQLGNIHRCYERDPAKPLPAGILRNEKAMFLRTFVGQR
jgi:hypothetical protein